LGVDKETVDNVFLSDSIFVGDGGIPHNPTVGEEPSPNPWNDPKWFFVTHEGRNV
jgi:hypothetical protein